MNSTADILISLAEKVRSRISDVPDAMDRLAILVTKEEWEEFLKYTCSQKFTSYDTVLPIGKMYILGFELRKL